MVDWKKIADTLTQALGYAMTNDAKVKVLCRQNDAEHGEHVVILEYRVRPQARSVGIARTFYARQQR